MRITRFAVPATALVTTAALLAMAPPQRPVRTPITSDSTLHDPVARLQAQLDRGAVTLAFDSTFGYLPSLLQALGIPVSSQGLVFSRTSLQTDKIAPWAPRALYFNDDVYIGHVQEGHFLEVASMHPERGAVFYTLNQDPTRPPTFQREGRQCLMCHESKVTLGVPGLMTLSTITDRLGYPITGVQDEPMSDATPLVQRFGGWYVTGSHGPRGHSGNVRSPRLSHEVDKARYRSQFDLNTESERTSLGQHFDTTAYLAGQSDLVALMVLVHQTTVHNLVTRVHALAREADRQFTGSRDTVPGGIPMTPALQMGITRLVQALFFDEEARLTTRVHGTTTFTAEFASRGPRDRQGRSLRDFDLEQRLFRHPLSFLIYSDGIRTLPPVARRELFRQVRAALGRGAAPSPLKHPLDAATREAITGILHDTFPDVMGGSPDQLPEAAPPTADHPAPRQRAGSPAARSQRSHRGPPPPPRAP